MTVRFGRIAIALVLTQLVASCGSKDSDSSPSPGPSKQPTGETSAKGGDNSETSKAVKAAASAYKLAKESLATQTGITFKVRSQTASIESVNFGFNSPDDAKKYYEKNPFTTKSFVRGYVDAVIVAFNAVNATKSLPGFSENEFESELGISTEVFDTEGKLLTGYLASSSLTSPKNILSSNDSAKIISIISDLERQLAPLGLKLVVGFSFDFSSQYRDIIKIDLISSTIDANAIVKSKERVKSLIDELMNTPSSDFKSELFFNQAFDLKASAYDNLRLKL